MGVHRILTDAQIRRVLAWDRAWQAFRERQGDARQLAARLGVRPHVVYYCLHRSRCDALAQSRADCFQQHSRVGRPTLLSPGTIRKVIAWRQQQLKFLERHGTVQALAGQMGVSVRTIHAYIEHYRCASELGNLDSDLTCTPRTSVRPKVRADWRSILLRKWKRGATEIHYRGATPKKGR